MATKMSGSIPIWHGMKLSDVRYVLDVLNKFHK